MVQPIDISQLTGAYNTLFQRNELERQRKEREKAIKKQEKEARRKRESGALRSALSVAGTALGFGVGGPGGAAIGGAIGNTIGGLVGGDTISPQEALGTAQSIGQGYQAIQQQNILEEVNKHLLSSWMSYQYSDKSIPHSSQEQALITAEGGMNANLKQQGQQFTIDQNKFTPLASKLAPDKFMQLLNTAGGGNKITFETFDMNGTPVAAAVTRNTLGNIVGQPYYFNPKNDPAIAKQAITDRNGSFLLNEFNSKRINEDDLKKLQPLIAMYTNPGFAGMYKEFQSDKAEVGVEEAAKNVIQDLFLMHGIKDEPIQNAYKKSFLAEGSAGISKVRDFVQDQNNVDNVLSANERTATKFINNLKKRGLPDTEVNDFVKELALIPKSTENPQIYYNQLEPLRNKYIDNSLLTKQIATSKAGIEKYMTDNTDAMKLVPNSLKNAVRTIPGSMDNAPAEIAKATEMLAKASAAAGTPPTKDEKLVWTGLPKFESVSQDIKNQILNDSKITYDELISRLNHGIPNNPDAAKDEKYILGLFSKKDRNKENIKDIAKDLSLRGLSLGEYQSEVDRITRKPAKAFETLISSKKYAKLNNDPEGKIWLNKIKKDLVNKDTTYDRAYTAVEGMVKFLEDKDLKKVYKFISESNAIPIKGEDGIVKKYWGFYDSKSKTWSGKYAKGEEPPTLDFTKDIWDKAVKKAGVAWGKFNRNPLMVALLSGKKLTPKMIEKLVETRGILNINRQQIEDLLLAEINNELSKKGISASNKDYLKQVKETIMPGMLDILYPTKVEPVGRGVGFGSVEPPPGTFGLKREISTFADQANDQLSTLTPENPTSQVQGAGQTFADRTQLQGQQASQKISGTQVRQSTVDPTNPRPLAPTGDRIITTGQTAAQKAAALELRGPIRGSGQTPANAVQERRQFQGSSQTPADAVQERRQFQGQGSGQTPADAPKELAEVYYMDKGIVIKRNGEKINYIGMKERVDSAIANKMSPKELVDRIKESPIFQNLPTDLQKQLIRYITQRQGSGQTPGDAVQQKTTPPPPLSAITFREPGFFDNLK